MMYLHHGNKAFGSYDDYLVNDVDESDVAYLQLDNEVAHDVNPNVITIAEDVSGMPGLALSAADGGVGFDFRFSMGVPDYWIRLVKDTPDEAWPMGAL